MTTNMKCVWLLALFLPHLLLSVEAAYYAEILSGPETQIAPVGTTVVFNCHIRGDGYWVFDGESVHYIDYDDFPGFDFSLQVLKYNPYELNLTITVEVTEEYNGTEIYCEGTGSYTNQMAVSDTALLIAASPPASPVPTAEHVNATTIELSWSVPFTHEGFGVDYYTVEVEKQATGEVTTATIAETHYTISMAGGVAQVCEEVICTVTATNTIGESDGVAVSTGFPTVPGELATDVTADVAFRADLSPIVKLNFELPETCTFQTSWYTVVVDRENASGDPMVHMYGPTPFTSGDPVSVEEDISSGLERNRNYIVTVYVESLAGRSPNITASFNTSLAFPTSIVTVEDPPTDEIHDTTPGDPTPVTDDSDIEDTSPEPTESESDSDDLDTYGVGGEAAAESKETDRNNEVAIIAGTVGGVVVMVLLMFGIVVVVFMIYRNKHREAELEGGKRRPPMVPNPIYEPSTPIYESVEDPQWKALIKKVHDPTDSYKDPRYFNVPPAVPSVPPPRKPVVPMEPEEKGTEEIKASFSPGFPAGDECYTVMNSAGTLSRQNSHALGTLPVGDEYVTISAK